MGPDLVVVVHRAVAHAAVDHLQSQPALQAGQRRARAEVDDVAEADVPVGPRTTWDTAADRPIDGTSVGA